jgi:hypothetical protein
MLWRAAPRKAFIALNKSELVGRMIREVNAGRLPGSALALLDSGVPVSLLHQCGYTPADLRKAEAAVDDLLKSRSGDRAARSPRTVEVDADELARLRKIEGIIERFVRASGGANGGHPALRDAAGEVDD